MVDHERQQGQTSATQHGCLRSRRGLLHSKFRSPLDTCFCACLGFSAMPCLYGFHALILSTAPFGLIAPKFPHHHAFLRHHVFPLHRRFHSTMHVLCTTCFYCTMWFLLHPLFALEPTRRAHLSAVSKSGDRFLSPLAMSFKVKSTMTRSTSSSATNMSTHWA